MRWRMPGMAAAKGVELSVPKTTSLLDAMNPQAQRFYGYDCAELVMTREGERVAVEFVPRETLPTAEEIERAYCHAKHPNPMMAD